MKVRFVWMTPSKGMMLHLVPDIMLLPTESSFIIVAGWLNMHKYLQTLNFFVYTGDTPTTQ